MAKVTIRKYDGSIEDVIEAEIIHDVFAIHLNQDGKWVVSHTLSGWHLLGTDGPFDKYEQAKVYAESLASAKIMWFFENQQQMIDWNGGKDNVLAIATGARLMANMV